MKYQLRDRFGIREETDSDIRGKLWKEYEEEKVGVYYGKNKYYLFVTQTS
jgi:hypothetical protein